MNAEPAAEPEPIKLKDLRSALLRMRTATGPVGALAFWSEDVVVKRSDRDAVCAALEKHLAVLEKN